MFLAEPRPMRQVVLLFNFSTRQLHGLFRMAETLPGGGGQPAAGLNLVPEAWAGSGGGGKGGARSGRRGGGSGDFCFLPQQPAASSL